MTQSKSQKERQWNVRKQSQNPSHGKVKSFEEQRVSIKQRIGRKNSEIKNRYEYKKRKYKIRKNLKVNNSLKLKTLI